MKRRFLLTEKGIIIKNLIDNNVPDVVLLSKSHLANAVISQNGQDVTIYHVDGTVQDMFIYPNGLVSYGNRNHNWDEKIAQLTEWEG